MLLTVEDLDVGDLSRPVGDPDRAADRRRWTWAAGAPGQQPSPRVGVGPRRGDGRSFPVQYPALT